MTISDCPVNGIEVLGVGIQQYKVFCSVPVETCGEVKTDFLERKTQPR